MWNTTKFEQYLQERLAAEFDEARSGRMYSTYEITRGKLVTNIFQEIPAVEPNLSDHGPDHIQNVLNNAWYLLNGYETEHELAAIDLYVLAMSILFHDVGNLYGREDHHKKLGEVFDWARSTDAVVRREKTLVMRIAGAHTGLASDGSRDTLKEIDEIDHLDGESVQLRSIASILRFADELAEGPQRSSEFRRQLKLYDVESQIYQEYASVTHVRIDRANERVLLTYELDANVGEESRDESEQRLTTLMSYIYHRAIKLDQERRYARFYSDVLLPFKATRIAFNFHCYGNLLAIDLPPLQLDDKVIPGDSTKELGDIDSRYLVKEVVGAVLGATSEEATQ